MKNRLKYLFIIVVLALVYKAYSLYPKLDILSGFTAKSIASHLFVGAQKMETTIKEDNDIPLMNLPTSSIDLQKRMVTSSTFGLKSRKAVYKEGIGCVLIPSVIKNVQLRNEVPQRKRTPKSIHYPYGNLAQKDTLFEHVNYNSLDSIISNLFVDQSDHKKKTRSILVIYKNQIIGEKYAEGYDRGSVLLGWSMAKSVTSTVLGVMEKDGLVHLEQKNIFEEWRNDERKHITLKNLINMNSGLEWEEDYSKISDATKMIFLEPNMGKPQILKKLVGPPNESWNYSSGTSNLLSGFMRDQFTTHQSYLDYWYEELIDKIGMHSMLIETDYSGHYVGSSYAWANTRDWAKLGLLYLHEGNWNGEQIIDTSWVNFTKKPTNSSEGAYGGHFWLNAGLYYPDVPEDMYSCNGFQGQRIFIIPSKELVIVRIGLVETPGVDFNRLLSDIISCIK